MPKLTRPARRYIDCYYYDENNDAWFYIVNANPNSGTWTIDLVVHTVTGWKRRNDPAVFRHDFDAKKFANKPFTVG